jgi:hypothetical protein
MVLKHLKENRIGRWEKKFTIVVMKSFFFNRQEKRIGNLGRKVEDVYFISCKQTRVLLSGNSVAVLAANANVLCN